MQTILSIRGAKGVRDFRPQRQNTMVKPKVKRTYFDGQVRMYETTDGRTFFADAYDWNFKVKVQARVLPRHHKNKSIDPRVID